MKPLWSLLLAVALAGCAAPNTGNAPSPRATVQLTATLISPTDIGLKWHDANTRAAGHTIEYATDPNGPFVILAFLPPNETTFLHSNLMPQTIFYYRVRAIYGPASAPLTVSLPSGLSDTDYVRRTSVSEDYGWAIPKTIAAKTTKASVRTAPKAAAPTNLRATLMPVTVSGVEFTWTDHAADEDGYLLEIKPDGAHDFQVAALLAADINAFGYSFTPPDRKAAFRVRAFYYGTPSTVAQQTTGLPAAHKMP